MAAIAHSDPYSIFIRKIGYSVGLEYTMERVTDLHALYASNKDLTSASWNKLVGSIDNWGLKSDNITDFFYSLRLIQRTQGDLLVLENLDAMAIASAMLGNKEEQYRARAFILLWAIIANDGEIFVNLLQARFEVGRIKEQLTAMIAKKRNILRQALPGKESFRRINRIVNIERQDKNKGGAGTGKSITSLNRTESLHSRRTLPVSEGSLLDTIEFSEDYFRKIPPRRKDWARSLGLWDDKSGLTDRGKKFLDVLKKMNYSDENGVFIYWPMDYELVRAGFRPNILDNAKSLWQSLVELCSAYADLNVRPISEEDPDKAVLLIKDMMCKFRNLNARKSLLRRELPATIVYPAVVAVAAARGEPIIDLPAVLAIEQKGEKRRVAVRQSRNTGIAFSIKRNT